MENLEITAIRGAGIGEAPLQRKANCGTLLIDDFGRQKMPVDQLLNRWMLHNLPFEVTAEAIDKAVGNDFSIMS